jgi:hypothetical protein
MHKTLISLDLASSMTSASCRLSLQIVSEISFGILAISVVLRNILMD